MYAPGAYDIEFPSLNLGFMLFDEGDDPGLEGGWSPSELGEDEAPIRDVPMQIATYDGGMGVTQPADAVPGGYAFGRSVCTRFGVAMPAGGVTEVLMNLGLGVTDLDVGNPGSGYLTPPLVIVSGGGGQAAHITAQTLGGKVVWIQLASNGSGYTTDPLVWIGAPDQPGGVQATAIAVRSANTVVGITVVNQGSGYSTPPTVALVGGRPSGAVLSPIVNVPAGNIVWVGVANGGSGYVSGQVTVTAYGAGTGFVPGAITVVNGVITAVAITATGAGYFQGTTSLVVTSTTPQTVAAIDSVSLGGSPITGFTIVRGGYGYSSVPTVTVSPPPSGVTATAVNVEIGTVGPAPCYAAAEFEGDLYFFFGRHAYVIEGGDAPGPITTPNHDFGPGVTVRSAVTHMGNLYVGTEGGAGVPGATLWCRKSIANGGNWTQIDPSTGKPTWARVSHLKSVYLVDGNNVGSQRLVGVRSSGARAGRAIIFTSGGGADPLVGGDDDDFTLGQGVWSAEYPIGDSTTPVNSLAATGQHVYPIKTDGIHDLDGRGRAPNFTEYWKEQLNEANGQASLVHNGFLYASHAQGLDRYPIQQTGRAQQRVGFCGPGTGLSNETPIRGPATALTTESGWLVGAFYAGPREGSYVMYGRDRGELGREEGRGPMVWHGSEMETPGERITLMRPAQLEALTPRLWVASVVTDPASDRFGQARLRWMHVAQASSPIQELLQHLHPTTGAYIGAMRWASTWEITHTSFDWGSQVPKKVILRTDIRADRLNSDPQNIVALRVFGRGEDGAWIQQGSGPDLQAQIQDPKAVTSPRSSLLPTSPLVAGHSVQMKVVGSSPDSIIGMGAGATAVATLDGSGGVGAIEVVQGGGNYDTLPTVVLTGGNGTGAAAHAVVSNGVVVGVVVDQPGIEYDTPPTVSFRGSGVTNEPAILREFRTRAEIIQEARDNRTYRIRIGPRVFLKNGSPDPREPQQILDELFALQSAEPQWMIDNQLAYRQSSRKWVRVNPGITYKPVKWKREGENRHEITLVATISISVIPSTAEEISLGYAASERSRARLGFRWNSGVKWNSGRQWG
jgi:hypothetical protein